MFHHRNSKCFLLTVEMVQIDECFFHLKVAGVNSLLDVPSSATIPEDTAIKFGSNVATVGELRYEEQTVSFKCLEADETH